MGRSPSFTNRGYLGEFLDVEVFTQSHRASGFAHRDLHTVLLEDLHKDDGGCDHVGISDRPAPIENDTSDLAPVAPGECVFRVVHDCSLVRA